MKKSSWILAFTFLLAAGAQAKDLELPVAKSAARISQNPFDSAWDKAAPLVVPLMPQSIAPPGGGGAVKSVRVKAILGKEEILFRLDWADASVDNYPSKAENFTDSAALQFPDSPGRWPSPFMGDRENAVVIWRWSASAQKDINVGYQSAKSKRPRLTAGGYPEAGDTTFLAGEGAGNIISNKGRHSPIENLAAKGFGTLTVQGDQPVNGRGVRKDGRWYVVFRRALNGHPPFWLGNRMPFAVGVWNGRKSERDGIKSVSIWQTLKFPGAGKRGKETQITKGRRVYQRFGCGTCHGVDAEGGVDNPNAQTNPIPGLTKVKEGFSKEELLDVVYNGREPARNDVNGPPARFKMNAWRVLMSKREGNSLAAYLFSLMKGGDEW